ncbi:MAG TPA: hypothetical protein VGK19_14360 [Capsulimonadaceae bacterium]|jgi:hypothetical protein
MSFAMMAISTLTIDLIVTTTDVCIVIGMIAIVCDSSIETMGGITDGAMIATTIGDAITGDMIVTTTGIGDVTTTTIATVIADKFS